jgi:Zinc binding domain
MACCPTESGADQGEKSETRADEISEQLCRKCESQSRPVSRKTVLLMLKPHLIEDAMTGTYCFCSTVDCPIVYFEEQGNQRFSTNDLRITVGVKAKIDPIPVCYCFGFDESHIRDEISRTGATTIPDRISKLIREGLCACESRNPAGVCCLGEVNRAAKRLKASRR